MKKQQEIVIRPYEETDFAGIHKLNEQEGWNNLVAEQDGRLVGCLRTDGWCGDALYM